MVPSVLLVNEKILVGSALDLIINDTGTDGEPDVAEEEETCEKHIGPYVRSFSIC